MKYFNFGMVKEEVEKEYKRLSKIWHPDMKGGSTKVMQDINREHDLISRDFSNNYKDTKKEEYSWHNDTKRDNAGKTYYKKNDGYYDFDFDFSDFEQFINKEKKAQKSTKYFELFSYITKEVMMKILKSISKYSVDLKIFIKTKRTFSSGETTLIFKLVGEMYKIDDFTTLLEKLLYENGSCVLEEIYKF
jgi:curved DNA-binding protein CbpA